MYSINIPKLPLNSEKRVNQENNNSSNNYNLSQRLNISTNYDNLTNKSNKKSNLNIIEKTYSTKENINSNFKIMKNAKKIVKSENNINKINSINLISNIKNKINNQGLKINKETIINKYNSYNNANKTCTNNNNILIENNGESITIHNNKISKSPQDKVKYKVNQNLINKTRKSPDICKHNNNFYVGRTLLTNDMKELKKFIQTNKNFISATNSNRVSPETRNCNNSNSRIQKTNNKKKELINIPHEHNMIKNVSSNKNVKRQKSVNSNKKNREISFKGKIFHNNSDLKTKSLRKNGKILIDPDINSELKMVMSQRKMIKNGQKQIKGNNANRLLKSKNLYSNSSLEKKCSNNDKKVKEKKVHRSKNIINLKNKKGSPSPKMKIIKKSDPDKKNDFCLILRNNQINNCKNESIIYGPFSKIDSISYQNNNINNFYIIHDNINLNNLNMNKTLRRPNYNNRNFEKDSMDDSSKIDKNNLTFNEYNIGLNRTRSLNKTKKEVTLKYFINNEKMRNNSCYNKRSESIRGNIIKSNERTNGNYDKNNNNIIPNNHYNNMGERWELSKNTKFKREDSNFRIKKGGSEFNAKERELNITPKKKKDRMRINPVKLLGDFKKEFKNFSKNDKKNI